MIPVIEDRLLFLEVAPARKRVGDVLLPGPDNLRRLVGEAPTVGLRSLLDGSSTAASSSALEIAANWVAAV